MSKIDFIISGMIANLSKRVLYKIRLVILKGKDIHWWTYIFTQQDLRKMFELF